MYLRNTIFSMSVLIGLLFASCSTDDNNKKDARVSVTVVSATNERLPGEIVKMYDEKSYEEFKKDNTTPPTTYLSTDSNGVATFIFSYDEWFKTSKDRFFTFVVQYGSGTENYEIWSSGRTVAPGSNVRIELKLQSSI